MKIFSSIILTTVLCMSISLKAQNKIKLDKIAQGFVIPVDIAQAGDDRLFVVGKRGVIKGFNKNTPQAVFTFLDITSKVSSSANEKGLLGMAFDPDYDNNGYFYINYSDQSRNSVVARYRVSADNANEADPGSEKIVMTIPQPFNNHNGGCLKFGPDGYLYIGWGDGGAGGDPDNRSQNGQELLGKMLRIDVRTDQPYVIPSSNPFIGNDQVKDEIWAIGLRNPWRYSFDRLTGDLWIADVGQNLWEEVNFQSADSKGGENYGWRCYEAEAIYNGQNCAAKSTYDFPIHFYRNQRGTNGCSVTGGFVYRGSAMPNLYGHYIYGDFCSGKIWSLVRDSSGNVTNEEIFQFSGNQIASFGEDNDGELYITALRSGEIYRINSECSAQLPCLEVQDENLQLCGVDTFLLASCKAPDGYIYRWFQDGNPLLLGQDTISRLTVTQTGAYRVQWKNDECDLGVSKPVLVTLLDQPDQPELSFNPDTLWATPGYTMYEWHYQDAVLTITSDNFLVVDQSGEYSVKVANNEDCFSEISEPYNVVITAIKNVRADEIDADIFPNPFGSQLEITWPKHISNPSIAIYNHDSVLMYEMQFLKGNKASINTSNWSNGLYFILLRTGEKHFTGKAIKME